VKYGCVFYAFLGYAVVKEHLGFENPLFLKSSLSCPKIAIHKKSVYGTPRTRDLCFTRAQAEPF
jgi:hypothetical protein